MFPKKTLLLIKMDIFRQILLKIMNDNDIDAVIASTRENIQYLKGFCPISKLLKPYLHSCFAILLRDNPNIIHLVHFNG